MDTFLVQVLDYHNSVKWNDIGNGYRWRVEQSTTVGGQHDAVVIGSGGGQLYRISHFGFERAEQDAIRACHDIRNSYWD